MSETEDRENKLDREVGKTKYGNFGLEKFGLFQQGEEIKSSKFIHWENDARKKGWVQEHWEPAKSRHSPHPHKVKIVSLSSEAKEVLYEKYGNF